MDRVKVEWVSGKHFIAHTSSGHSIHIDAPRGRGGEGKGPNSVDLVLSALAGCTAMDVADMISKTGGSILRLEVEAEADLHASGEPSSGIHVIYRVAGQGFDQESLMLVLENSHNVRWLVGHLLQESRPLTFSYQLNSEPVQGPKPVSLPIRGSLEKNNPTGT